MSLPLDFFPEDEDTSKGDRLFECVVLPFVAGILLSLLYYAIKTS